MGTMTRLEQAQFCIIRIDELLKDNNLSLVVRNGKPYLYDHVENQYYSISFSKGDK